MYSGAYRTQINKDHKDLYAFEQQIFANIKSPLDHIIEQQSNDNERIKI